MAAAAAIVATLGQGCCGTGRFMVNIGGEGLKEGDGENLASGVDGNTNVVGGT